ncbi:MAG: PHP domain-containing protein [Ruminococcaceae bacterium]|nr:PHP domain-containing protein [Oscillospiraceae bacterium]
MNRYYYDFHLHSCLSPCGDDDNTPNNIAGMATLLGLNMIALTDHNTCKNCPAFFEAAKRYGLIPVAGMELTTSEDIHVVCLFEELSDAMAFDEEIDSRRVKIKNRVDIFGNQFILDGEDNIIGEDGFLLSNATTVSLDEAPSVVGKYNGICYPAHIDRQSNGVIAVLGTFPETPHFDIVEINRKEKIDEYVKKYSLEDKRVIVSSDAHILTDMREHENYFEIDDEPYSLASVRHKLFELLRKK